MVNLIRVDSQALFLKKKKNHINDILRKISQSVLFKVINLFNRKQTMYHFEIAEGKKKFLLRTQILQQKRYGEKKEPGSIKSGNKIIWQR